MGVSFFSPAIDPAIITSLQNKTQFLDTNGEFTASPFGGTYQLVNADIAAAAAIVQSKLVDIVNADIDAAAAIAKTKLAALDIVNADINAAAAIALSKLAATPALIDTDTYTGDGTLSNGITGVGFAPQYVRIWRQLTSGTWTSKEICETTDLMVVLDAAGLMVSWETPNWTARTNGLISLDADGFTVDDAGGDLDPNKDTIVYQYLAIG